MADEQAFPVAWGNHEQGGDYVPGMTLRDWFAGQTVAGFCGTKYLTAEDIARAAYEVADAMMTQRNAE